MNFQLAAIGHSFKGSMAYYMHDKRQDETAPHLDTADRVAWTETRNLATDGPQTATRIMIATAQSADELKAAAGVKNTGRKATAGPVFAFSLAWHPSEAEGLTRQDMTSAADHALKTLGIDHLQSVIIAHQDTKHPHVHVVVNRVDPGNGKMTVIGKPAVFALDKWADRYERERGHIVSPNRAAKHDDAEQKRKQYPDPDERRRHTAAKKAVPPSSRGESDGALLKDLHDAQKARHKAAWPALSAQNKAERDGLYSDYAAKMREANATHRALCRPIWGEHFREARNAERNFAAREKEILGTIHNALNAAKHQMQTGQAPQRGILSLTFANVLSAEKRQTAFMEQQDIKREALAAQLRRALDADIASLKGQRGVALQHQRIVFDGARENLIRQQAEERGKMSAAWRQLYERRGASGAKFKYHSQGGQNALLSLEQKLMKKDFDKARELASAKPVPHPTEQRFVSSPAPAPSPAGTVPTPNRAVQNVPKQPDQSKAVPVKAATPSPSRDWNAAAAPDKTPTAPPPKDWNAKTPEPPREIKPLPPRDRSKDHDRER
jgi:hypothetical protein